ncbi:hypothetical protein [Stappia sp. TSB10P1A]|uniref:hypothetical protein n=1 Tax=Stappia sp. TSB10P1A TaxID=2003585 RepID=UPI0016438D4E|nr:hypothetical protein [Stappia sp. TSB10P1A]
MLSDDIRTLIGWIDANARPDGSLALQPAMTGLLRLALRDAARTARGMEASRISGPAMISEADLASGKVKRLPIVPRPVPAPASDDGGSAA